MININNTFLRLISTKDENKDKYSIDESFLLSSYLYTISNLAEFFKEMKVNELALFINSINDWMKNKTQSSTRKVKVGDIIEIECGLNYSGEISYRHWCVVIESMDKTVLCIPTTSRKEYIEKSSEKENGIWYYKLVGTNEGFNHDCVLMLNNIKSVSKKRLKTQHGNILETETGKEIFKDSKIHILQHYFARECLEFEKNNDVLKNEIDDLKKANRELKNKINSLYRKINNLYEKLNHKKSKAG